MLITFRGRLVMSVLLLSGRANTGLGLVLAHHILVASICLIGPGAHCDNMVQARRPGKPIIRHQVPSVQERLTFFVKNSIFQKKVTQFSPIGVTQCMKRPDGKIGLYTSYKKNGWMSFIKHSDKSRVCYMKPLDSLKNWNDLFFWVDEFACPVRFPWHSAKNVTRDPAPKATDFNAQDYCILFDHPSPFRKFPEEFLCLVGLSRHYTLDEKTYRSFVDRDGEDMDIFAFIHTPDPTKVKIIERERQEDEPRGTHVEQGDSAGGRDGQDTNIHLLTETADAIVEDITPLQPRHQRKRKTAAVDVGGPSRPPKKLREDHVTLGGPSVAEAEVDSFVRPSIPVITAATTVTLTLDPATVVKKKTVKPSVFVADSSSAGRVDPNAGVFSDLTESDFLSMTNGSRLDDGRVCHEMVDEFTPPKFFASIHEMDHDQLFIEFNVRAARQISLSAEVRMRVEYNIKEKRKLKTIVDEHADLLKAREGEIESLKAKLLLKEAKVAEAIRLRTETSHFKATEKSLRDEVNALNGHNLILEKERDALDVKVVDLEASIKVREQEAADLDALVTFVKLQNDNLADQVHKLEASSVGLQEKVTAYENFID
ncbi:hypothetical protein Tco_0882596 [Tanacetum coccineum]